MSTHYNGGLAANFDEHSCEFGARTSPLSEVRGLWRIEH